jgi:hypothetical protein
MLGRLARPLMGKRSNARMGRQEQQRVMKIHIAALIASAVLAASPTAHGKQPLTSTSVETDSKKDGVIDGTKVTFYLREQKVAVFAERRDLQTGKMIVAAFFIYDAEKVAYSELRTFSEDPFIMTSFRGTSTLTIIIADQDTTIQVLDRDDKMAYAFRREKTGRIGAMSDEDFDEVKDLGPTLKAALLDDL